MSQIYAYNLARASRDSTQDFNSLRDAGTGWPTGLWSDGSTMWVTNHGSVSTKIYSFNMPIRISYDRDGDGLIEIGNLAQLNAIRWDRDGDGAADRDTNAVAYAAAFPNATAGMGCAGTCVGYELVGTVSFDENGDGHITAADGGYWNGGAGWLPIGRLGGGFTATFEGNGHTIANLYINRSGNYGFGLFALVGPRGQVRNVGVRDLSITNRGFNAEIGGLVGKNHGDIVACYAMDAVTNGSGNVGGLVGKNHGDIVACYATDVVTNGSGNVGGLVGRNFGDIVGSYATGTVSGFSGGGLAGANSGDIVACYAMGAVTSGGEKYGFGGGLVGRNSGDIVACYATGAVTLSGSIFHVIGGFVGENFGDIVACYATGAVASSNDDAYVGGLVGHRLRGAVSSSYWNIETSGQATSDGGIGKTTAQLKSPTSYTGIYTNWNVDLDNADGDGDATTGGDDPWDFGTASEYPVPRVYPPPDALQPTNGGTTTAATDFNGDGRTDFQDFFLFADAYGGTNAKFDLDGSGTVDFADFFKFVDAFGS